MCKGKSAEWREKVDGYSCQTGWTRKAEWESDLWLSDVSTRIDEVFLPQQETLEGHGEEQMESSGERRGRKKRYEEVESAG